MCLQVYNLLADLFTHMHSSQATIDTSQDRNVFLIMILGKLFNLKISSQDEILFVSSQNETHV